MREKYALPLGMLSTIRSLDLVFKKIKIYECLINIENSYLMEKFPVTFVYFGSFRQQLSPSLHI